MHIQPEISGHWTRLEFFHLHCTLLTSDRRRSKVGSDEKWSDDGCCGQVGCTASLARMTSWRIGFLARTTRPPPICQHQQSSLFSIHHRHLTHRHHGSRLCHETAQRRPRHRRGRLRLACWSSPGRRRSRWRLRQPNGPSSQLCLACWPSSWAPGWRLCLAHWPAPQLCVPRWPTPGPPGRRRTRQLGAQRRADHGHPQAHCRRRECPRAPNLVLTAKAGYPGVLSGDAAEPPRGHRQPHYPDARRVAARRPLAHPDREGARVCAYGSKRR
jgi:hypothetical protein